MKNKSIKKHPTWLWADPERASQRIHSGAYGKGEEYLSSGVKFYRKQVEFSWRVDLEFWAIFGSNHNCHSEGGEV